MTSKNSFVFLNLLYAVVGSVLPREDGSANSANSTVFSPEGLNASQPIPALFLSEPNNTYIPIVTPGPNVVSDNIPPLADQGNLTALDGSNWLSTWLFGYEECNQRFTSGKARIDDAYYDMFYLTNVDGIMKNIDWNSAAALEFLGPPANNKRYQDRMQEIFALCCEHNI